jgi:hypothetical protein
MPERIQLRRHAIANGDQPGTVRSRLPQHLAKLVNRSDQYDSPVKEPARA